MPSEIKSKEEFLKILPRAYECRIKQGKDYVKIKLRTKSKLYTFKTTQETLNELLPMIKCQIINL
ncbi:MAG: hypothetical protein RQ922_01205 [Thermoproteota archaeon]|jgi:hypothetical protein|nr:hypothetical protein [Thermoproteota archaeon]